jgi:hypothetical protein
MVVGGCSCGLITHPRLRGVLPLTRSRVFTLVYLLLLPYCCHEGVLWQPGFQYITFSEITRAHLLLGLSTTWRSTRKLRADATTVEMTLAMFWSTTTGSGVAASHPAVAQNTPLLIPMLRSA